MKKTKKDARLDEAKRQDREAIRRVFERDPLPQIVIPAGTTFWDCSCGVIISSQIKKCPNCGAKRKV